MWGAPGSGLCSLCIKTKLWLRSYLRSLDGVRRGSSLLCTSKYRWSQTHTAAYSKDRGSINVFCKPRKAPRQSLFSRDVVKERLGIERFFGGVNYLVRDKLQFKAVFDESIMCYDFWQWKVIGCKRLCKLGVFEFLSFSSVFDRKYN